MTLYGTLNVFTHLRLFGFAIVSVLVLQCVAEESLRDDEFFESRRRSDLDGRMADLLVELDKKSSEFVLCDLSVEARYQRTILWKQAQEQRFVLADARYLAERAEYFLSYSPTPDWDRLGAVFQCAGLGLYSDQLYRAASRAVEVARPLAKADSPDAFLHCISQALSVLAQSSNPVDTDVVKRAAQSTFWNAEGGSSLVDFREGDRRHFLREAAVNATVGMPAEVATMTLEELIQEFNKLGVKQSYKNSGAASGRTWDEWIASKAWGWLEQAKEMRDYMASVRYSPTSR